MKTLIAASFMISVAMLAGCGPNSIQAQVEPGATVTRLELTPENSAVLQQASQVARNATGGWNTLTSEQKSPFLQLNGNNEEKARTHYTGLVDTEREVQKNLSGS